MITPTCYSDQTCHGPTKKIVAMQRFPYDDYEITTIPGIGSFYLDNDKKTPPQNVAAVVKPGDTIVEIGAGFGTHTILFSKLVGPQGCVIAFELNFKSFRELIHNLSLNSCKNVTAYKCNNTIQLDLLRISLMKIDVDNDELETLLTLRETIQELRPKILIKVMGSYFEERLDRFEMITKTKKVLREMGYTLFCLSAADWLATPNEL